MTNKFSQFFLVMLLVISATLVAPRIGAMELRPPVAPVKEKIDSNHGDRRVDHYFWMQEKNNPEVISYLNAENAYAQNVLATNEPLREKLFDEMRARVPAAESSVPYRDGDYYYYSRIAPGQQYRVHFRKKMKKGVPVEKLPEELILDENKLAAGKKFFALDIYSLSPDGKLLAYSIDETGYRQYVLRVVDLLTGKLLDIDCKRVTSMAWAQNRKAFFYTTESEVSKRSNQLYGLTFGKEAKLIFEEKDERFRLNLQTSLRGDFVFLNSTSATSSEVHFLRNDRPAQDWEMINERRPDVRYDVQSHNHDFYIRINDSGENYRLVKTPFEHTEPSAWQEIYPHRPMVKLEQVELFRDFMVLHEREKGVQKITIEELKSGRRQSLVFPETLYSLSSGDNRVWNANKFRYTYQSFTTPKSVFEHDLVTKTEQRLHQQKVVGAFDRNNYASERRYAKADDETLIPISLIYKKTTQLDGTAPLHLSAYGAYGSSARIKFSSDALSLLDRGVILAVAHVRGGGDLGPAWHDGGRLLNKKNTFSDFIRCAETLITDKYTNTSHLVIEGRSAGGLLMGAVTNMRPDLFKAVLSQVPFVDVLNTMLDPSLPLVVGEYEEWGNPTMATDYNNIKAYSPYDNLKPGNYPTILIKTALNDSQVMYWEPAKYVAKLRTMKRDSNPLLFVIDMNSGHGGASGRFEEMRERAFDYAFILGQMGINE